MQHLHVLSTYDEKFAIRYNSPELNFHFYTPINHKFSDALFSWNTRTYEATNYVRSEARNASRGLAARATSYSRHSSRTRSADIAKSNTDAPVAVIALDTNAGNSSFYRNNSGGRARSLHLTSVENPFVGQAMTGPTVAQKQQERWVALK